MTDNEKLDVIKQKEDADTEALFLACESSQAKFLAHRSHALRISMERMAFYGCTNYFNRWCKIAGGQTTNRILQEFPEIQRVENAFEILDGAQFIAHFKSVRKEGFFHKQTFDKWLAEKPKARTKMLDNSTLAKELSKFLGSKYAISDFARDSIKSLVLALKQN